MSVAIDSKKLISSILITLSIFSLLLVNACKKKTQKPTETNNTQNSGFYVQGQRIYEANGTEFILRGINHAHTWYTGELNTAIPAIAATNANCVRIVLSNGRRWTRNSSADVQNVINLCRQNRLISILEVHDCTGYPEQPGSAEISTAVDFWIELKNILIGQEQYLIINIANEPYGNTTTADDWANGHMTAISRLRATGFTHLLMVDAPNWGQDWENGMIARAREVFDADPKKNIVFSVHMYEVYSNDSKVNTYLQSFMSTGLPLVIGEFSAGISLDRPVAAQSILDRCNEYGIGYMGWSWKGNGPGLEILDIAQNWNGNPLTNWGNLLINGRNGIRTTSRTATVFD